MTRPRLRLLYNDAAEIGTEQFEKIIQCLVLVADEIILPSHVRVSPLESPEAAADIRRRMCELTERKRLTVWTYERLLDVPALAQAAWLPASTAMQVVPDLEHSRMTDALDETMLAYRMDVLRAGMRAPGVTLDGITEFVSLRNAFWSRGLTGLLDADQVLLSRRPYLEVPMQKTAAVSDLVEPMAKTLLDLRGLHSMYGLEAKQVERLRRYLPQTRKLLAELVDEQNDPLRFPAKGDLDAEVADHVQRRLLQVMQPKAGASVRRLGVSWTVNLLGLVHPLLQGLSFAQPIVEWINQGRGDKRLVTFVAQLDRLTAKDQSKKPISPERRGLTSPK